MAGMEREVSVMCSNGFVFGTRHADAFSTRRLPAFADQIEPLGFSHLEVVGQTLEPFVDFAEDRLVEAKTLFTEVHCAMLTRRGACAPTVVASRVELFCDLARSARLPHDKMVVALDRDVYQLFEPFVTDGVQELA
jgi:hypothetical protein